MKLAAAILLTLTMLSSFAFAYSFEDDNEAQALVEEGQNRAALRLCKPHAERGEAWAEYCLGQVYNCGKRCASSDDNVVLEDSAEAAKWYLKAAKQGHADAQFLLGYFYYSKAADYVNAVKWYLKAAQQGNTYAMHFLIGMYLMGQGVKQDYVAAYFWERLSSSIFIRSITIDGKMNYGRAKNPKPRLLTPEEQALQGLPSKLTLEQKAAVDRRVAAWKAMPSPLTQQENAAREEYYKAHGIGIAPHPHQ